ncbi:MAG: cytochrome c biogenesis protein CcsA [Bacteroidota bacterium]
MEQPIQYIGEHLLPGQIGHFAILLGFVSALLATTAYFFASHPRHLAQRQTWRDMGRLAFGVHGLSVFAIIGTIFYVMIQQYYEYQYVWAHVSEDLPFKYIFSAFWEGQEGSFLLWMFWHVILGLVIMRTAGKWESPVLSSLSLIQVFIGSMILGLYFSVGGEEYRIGSNPLMLLRDTMDAPIFAQADYLEVLKGTGLNPLLQNYWMTIHPPTLFLGFASTSIPFCFALAGLWTGQHKEWLRPVFPWALFSGAILGTGILMGGAWAYEALSFGGYWAWDPVENMSLVPWIILIAGIHGNLIGRTTGYSIRTTYLFYILTFVFIVYSTFLTRSGVLGDTSVHAFTEMGLETQLVLFLAFFTLLGLAAFAWSYSAIPAPVKEESGLSKEFWIFIGSLVLIFSSVLITVSTSLPVYNKIRQVFDPLFEGRVITDPIEHYNKYQLWIGVFVGILSGLAQYLRFREKNWVANQRRFWVHTIGSTVIAVGLTALAATWIEAKAWQYLLLLFSGIFAVVTNVDYAVNYIRGNPKLAASAFSHIGFGLMIVGILASGLNKEFISHNVFAQRGLIDGFTEQDQLQNILLFKGMPMFMNGYEVTYTSDTLDGFTRTFNVNYKRLSKEGEVEEEFDLQPNILYTKTFDDIAATNPSTKHYLNKDIFTHISSLPRAQIDAQYAQEMEDSLQYDKYTVAPGDTFFTTRYYAVLEEVTRQPSHPDYEPEPNDLAVGLKLAIHEVDNDKVHYAAPMLVLRGNILYKFPVEINALSVKVKLPDRILENIFLTEDQLDYERYQFSEKQEIDFGGKRIRFAGFNPQPGHPQYVAQPGDIAVGARLEIVSEKGTTKCEPVYLIRGNRSFVIKDEVLSEGLHFRFEEIDPATQTIQVNIAQVAAERLQLPIELSEKFRRSDYIVLQAILFPGINFFWTGSILMMLGLAVGMYRRMQEARP